MRILKKLPRVHTVPKRVFIHVHVCKINKEREKKGFLGPKILLVNYVILIINHHLVCHVCSPSRWVSGVMLKSLSTLIHN